jgi:electron transfer flavoprotein alpha subunit
MYLWASGGAMRHVVAIRDAKRIIAINKHNYTAVFQIAHLGIVGDALEVLPAGAEVLRRQRVAAHDQRSVTVG